MDADLIEGCAALQDAGVRITEGLQAVLKEVAPLALGADQQQLFVLGVALHGAGDLGEVDPGSAGDLRGRLDVQHLVVPGGSGGVLGGGEGLECAGELVFKDHAGLGEGMDGRGEGRRIGEIGQIEVVEDGLLDKAGDGDIHHLVHGSGAEDLDAQEAAGRPISDQLGDKAVRAGEIVGLVVGDADDRDGVIACGLGLGLGQAGTAGVQTTGQLDHTGAEAAAVGRRGAGQGLGEGAGRQIGGAAHGGPLALAGDGVFDHGAVAGGVDVGQVGLHILVHNDGALEQLDAAALEEGGGGTDADGQHDHVRREGAVVGDDGDSLVSAANGPDGRAGQNPEACLAELLLGVVGHFAVKGIGHDLIRRVDDRDGEALFLEVLSSLETDEARADDDGVAAAILLNVGAKGDGVLRRPQAEHAGQLFPVDGRDEGGRAGGNDQLVIGFGKFCAAVEVTDSDGLGRRIDGRDLAAGAHLSAGQSLILGWGVDNQLVPTGDGTAHIVGQATASVGDVFALGKDQNLSAPVLALDFGGRFGSRSDTANDNHSHNYSSCMIRNRNSVLIIPPVLHRLQVINSPSGIF